MHGDTVTVAAEGMAAYGRKPVIEDDVHIGSNCVLVAPVTIGAGAYTGSGSVITQGVAADALALGRPTQVQKDGWAARFRAAKLALKGKA